MKNRILLFLVLFYSSIGVAQDVSSKLNNVRFYHNCNYVTVFDSTKVDMQESGLSFVKIHRLHKILNKRGALELKNIILDYDPLSASVEFTKVSIWKNNGKEIEVSLDNVLDYPAYSHLIYWGARQKMIDLGAMQKGDGVEIEYKKKGFTYALLQKDDSNYIPPMRGHFYDIVPFYSSVPTLLKSYSITIPSSKNLQYKVFNADDVVMSENLKVDTKEYSFLRHNIKPLKKESAMLSMDDIGASVLMTTAKSWKQKAAWFHKVNEDYKSFESFPELDNLVTDLVKDAKTEYDSISILTHWVADNIRYCGVSMGKGEGYTLHNAKMNFHDRCGVCKDKAGMLITMLRSAGFESYPAMTMAGARIKDIPADQFNHCVAIVKVKSGFYKILDPTWVPFVRELWSSAEQQQNYLPGIPGGADLQITPISDPENHYINLSVKSKIDNLGNLTGVISLRAEGQSDSSFRGRLVRTSKANWDYIVKSLISSSDSKILIDSIKYTNPYDYSNPFEIYAEFSIPYYVIITGDEIIYESLAKKLFLTKYSHLRINTKPSSRQYDFKDRCSRLVNVSEEIELPYMMDIVYAPKVVDFSSNTASVKGDYIIESNILKLNLNVKLGKRVYKKYEWQDFRRVVEEHRNIIKEPIILKKK